MLVLYCLLSLLNAFYYCFKVRRLLVKEYHYIMCTLLQVTFTAYIVLSAS